MKELELTLRVRNNRLKQRRLSLGLTTHAIAEAAGVSYSAYIDMENMKSSPLMSWFMHECRVSFCKGKANGFTQWRCSEHKGIESALEDHPKRTIPEWRPSVMKLADFHRCTPEELFPSAVIAIEKSTAVVIMDAADIGMLLPESARQMALPPSDAFDEMERSLVIRKALATLSPRQEVVVRKHFGISCDEQTLRQIGGDMETSVEWQRQIELVALRKLRKRSDLRQLIELRPQKPVRQVVLLPRGTSRRRLM